MVIVAAVEQSDGAKLVAAEANERAEAFGEPIHVVHAMKRSQFPDSGFAEARAGKQIGPSDVRDAATQIAEKVADEIDGPVECVGLVDEPAGTVVQYAEEHEARYVAVSPHERSKPEKVFFGSTTQSILLNATTPVVSTLRR